MPVHCVAALPHQVTKDKDAAVRGQDFEKAGQLRDREMELKAKISAIIAGAKETSKAEAESVEGGGPQVWLNTALCCNGERAQVLYACCRAASGICQRANLPVRVSAAGCCQCPATACAVVCCASTTPADSMCVPTTAWPCR